MARSATGKNWSNIVIRTAHGMASVLLSTNVETACLASLIERQVCSHDKHNVSTVFLFYINLNWVLKLLTD